MIRKSCIYCGELQEAYVDPPMCYKCLNKRLEPLGKILFNKIKNQQNKDFKLPQLDKFINENNNRP